jgi:hypothetical protein
MEANVAAETIDEEQLRSQGSQRCKYYVSPKASAEGLTTHT